MQDVKLHLGCGPNILPGWLNVDIEPGPGGISRDLRQGVPSKDGQADFIFNEHFLEHITRAEGVKFLRECHRALKSGGVLRVSTPDLEYLVQRYVANDPISLPGVWEPKTRAVMLNEGLSLWGHKFVYDLSELIEAMREAGFTQIENKHWRESGHHAFLEIGPEQRPFNYELIVEATK